MKISNFAHVYKRLSIDPIPSVKRGCIDPTYLKSLTNEYRMMLLREVNKHESGKNVAHSVTQMINYKTDWTRDSETDINDIY